MSIKRKVISVLLALSLLLTSIVTLTGSLTVSAAAATRGDLNDDGVVDMKDVLLLRKFIANLTTLSDETVADVNADNSVDMKDVLLMRKYIANWDVTLAPMPDASEPASEEPTASEPSTEPSTASTEPSTASTAPSTAPSVSSDKLIPDQITMAYYDKDCTQYGITWHTYTVSSKPTVQYVKGRTTDAADFADAMTTAATSTHYDIKSMPYDYATNTFQYTNTFNVTDYCHQAVLKDLDFATEYSYRVGDADADQWSAIATFTTRKEVVDDFTFVNVTDTQSKNNISEAYTYMRKALEGAYSLTDPAFILHGGDFVETSSLLNQWRNMLNGNEDILMKTPLMMVCGNHDSTYKAADYVQMRHFNYGVDPTSMNSIIGIYYSFDYGNAHFIVLNSNSTSKRTDGTDDDASIDKAQYEWLKADLEANTQEWTFVALHHPLYAPAGKNNDEKPFLQAQLLKLFNDNHVDMVIQAHEHLYMRTYPMDGNGNALKSAATVKEDGVTYFKDPGAPIFYMTGKTGKSGDSPYGEYDSDPFAKIATGMETSFGMFHIEGNKLTVTANYTLNGQIKSYETFGIIHDDK